MASHPVTGQEADGVSTVKSGGNAAGYKKGTVLPRCLSLDLEVGIEDHHIHAFAAIRPDTGENLKHHGRGLTEALTKLDVLADGAAFLLGHNLIAFDLPHLTAAKPDLRLLKLPVVDTLRLSPLAFPRNPYHYLVKHYQDGQLKRGRVNDPELDARLTLDLFNDERPALGQASPDLLLAWHWLTTTESGGNGFNTLFSTLRRTQRPSFAQARTAMHELLVGNACLTQSLDIVKDAARHSWELAYALAWLSVSGSNSVMPPWVRHQFPEAGRLVRRLRDTACTDPACCWCREQHDARKELTRWFGFSDFRSEPKDDSGRPMQQSIIEAAMAGEHVLGILPTGAGKSLCYQIPALSRYHKTGALTVVISPLVALMGDQVAGLEERGIVSCVTINGMLSMPERTDAMDRVRLGDAGILIISPEQLRSITLRRVLNQREIGAWVVDEAHCISKWGHDFRPDYRYLGRFIREKAGSEPIPPVQCLTATAKPDVVKDILTHFKDELDIELSVFNGGTERSNLEFVVVQTTRAEKFAHIHQILLADLPPDTPGGAIVYCATRTQSEEVADFLQLKEMSANYYHAGLPPETRKYVQQSFITGELRVITATNAFGMGIDKPDVRLVIHASIPGSLENYLQEAGRAGRDRQAARCVLLYTPEDVEWQFGMSARSRLTRREIHGILRALRNLDRKKHMQGEVVATAGEILGEDEDNVFEQDSATDDTRVRTAIAWLEESVLLHREENRVQVFPSSLRVNSVDEASNRLKKQSIDEGYRHQLLAITKALIEADADEGISTDELMNLSTLSPERVRGALYDLERLGIANNDTALTAFVHTGVQRASQKRLSESAELEHALIDHLREAAPDMEKNETTNLHLRITTQQLKDAGHQHALPERLWRILRSLGQDGRGEGGAGGSLRLRKLDTETVQVTLLREWSSLEKTAELRRAAAGCLLDHLLACLPPGSRGTDLLAETTLGKLLAAIKSDLMLNHEAKKPEKLLDRALLWLHEQEVIRLNKGLAVFRPAMTIRLEEGKRGFANSDFEPLNLHYQEQVLQIHVMAEYVQLGLQTIADALRLAIDYFNLTQEKFLRRWLPNRDREISRQTTLDSWRSIVESLKNPIQQRIVADNREQTNVLVLAGPGSGKTRVLVHRIGYLLRVRRQNAHGILALAYNRHAAVDIRRRLLELVGNDARGVTVLTCHSLAMRLVGASFSGRAEPLGDDAFRKVMREAVALLRGEGLPPEEADEQRRRLMAGFRWILVDEYQDIGPEEYDLISALSGRTLTDEDDRISLFAVGDDDQNIYAFDGASVEFIRRFEKDYGASPTYLTDNYRSTSHMITAANALIEPAQQRMKVEHPIHINQARLKAPPGGVWHDMDMVARGRVQILSSGNNPSSQAQTVMIELQRLSALDTNWNWSACAVITRKWKDLDPVRGFCELHGIPVQMGNEQIPSFWRLRETQALLGWLRGREARSVNGEELQSWVDARTSGTWIELLQEAVDAHIMETGGTEVPMGHFIEWLAEWGREIRRRQHGLLLTTAHRAKGLEFDHVAVLDGHWSNIDSNEDTDAPRRLYYVAMTRARQTLALALFQTPSTLQGVVSSKRVEEPGLANEYFRNSHPLQDSLPRSTSILRRKPSRLPPQAPELARRYLRLSLSDVNLSFAGRFPVKNPVHRTIASLSPGDPLEVRVAETEPWKLRDHAGNIVGRFAKGFRPPSGMRCRSITVLAIVAWSREASEPQYQQSLKCDTWEVVVPEMEFEPE